MYGMENNFVAMDEGTYVGSATYVVDVLVLNGSILTAQSRTTTRIHAHKATLFRALLICKIKRSLTTKKDG